MNVENFIKKSRKAKVAHECKTSKKLAKFSMKFNMARGTLLPTALKAMKRKSLMDIPTFTMSK